MSVEIAEEGVETADNQSHDRWEVGSDDWYRDLLDNAYDMIQCVSPDGKFVYVNQAWRANLGYDESEVARICLWDIIHPSFHKHCQEYFSKLVSSGGTLGNVETIFVTKNKMEIFVEGCVTVRKVGGAVVHTRGIFRDISRRKQAEEEREKLIAELRDTLARVHNLERLVTVCAWTGRVKHKGRWLRIDEYLKEQFGVRISHGMCEEAMRKALAELEV